MPFAPQEPGRADRVSPRDSGSRLYGVPGAESRCAEPRFEDLWDRHGRSVYALACTLLGDEGAATRAVMMGMTDLARSTDSVSGKDARRSMARHVYRRSQELAGKTPRSPHLPPAMVWLGQLAQLQRACLALCLFGGHTHREAARLLGVSPMTVAELLTAALREVGRTTPGVASGA